MATSSIRLLVLAGAAFALSGAAFARAMTTPRHCPATACVSAGWVGAPRRRRAHRPRPKRRRPRSLPSRPLSGRYAGLHPAAPAPMEAMVKPALPGRRSTSLPLTAPLKPLLPRFAADRPARKPVVAAKVSPVVVAKRPAEPAPRAIIAVATAAVRSIEPVRTVAPVPAPAPGQSRAAAQIIDEEVASLSVVQPEDVSLQLFAPTPQTRKAPVPQVAGETGDILPPSFRSSVHRPALPLPAQVVAALPMQAALQPAHNSCRRDTCCHSTKPGTDRACRGCCACRRATDTGGCLSAALRRHRGGDAGDARRVLAGN